MDAESPSFVDSARYHEMAFRDGCTVGVGLRKDLTPEIEVPKEPDEAVRFVMSTDDVDRDGDTIAADGWKLGRYKRNPVVLFAHRYREPPIGRASKIQVEDGKLKADVEFTSEEENPFGAMVHRLVRGGFLKATSVGFIPLRFDRVQTENRTGFDIKEQELLEFSVVPVPSNPNALIDAKQAGIDVAPLVDWAQSVLDHWGEETGEKAWCRKDTLKQIVATKKQKINWMWTCAIEGHEHDSEDSCQACIDAIKARYDAGEEIEELRDDVKEKWASEAKPRVPRSGPGKGKSGIQTLVFANSRWNVERARAWCRNHDFYDSPIDQTDNSIRIRQFNPSACAPGSFQTLTQNFPEGLSAVQCTGKEAHVRLIEAVIDGAAGLERVLEDPRHWPEPSAELLEVVDAASASTPVTDAMDNAEITARGWDDVDDRSVLNQDKIRSRARRPTFDGTENTAWSAPTLADWLRGYNSHGGAEVDPSTNVADLPRAAKTWIAARTFLGEAGAGNLRDLTMFPVVRPSTNRLNGGALRAVRGGRGTQANIPEEAKQSAREMARRLLNEHFDADIPSDGRQADDDLVKVVVPDSYGVEIIDLPTAEAHALKEAISHAERQGKAYRLVEMDGRYAIRYETVAEPGEGGERGVGAADSGAVVGGLPDDLEETVTRAVATAVTTAYVGMSHAMGDQIADRIKRLTGKVE